jgi:hypothetical protein
MPRYTVTTVLSNSVRFMAPTFGLLKGTTCSAQFDTERLLKRHKHLLPTPAELDTFALLSCLSSNLPEHCFRRRWEDVAISRTVLVSFARRQLRIIVINRYLFKLYILSRFRNSFVLFNKLCDSNYIYYTVNVVYVITSNVVGEQ